MSHYKTHTINSAPEKAKPLLEKIQKQYEFLPNFLGKLANAPTVLEAYLSLQQFFEQTRFTPIERQVILLQVSVYNQCHYCVPVHTVLAEASKMPKSEIEAIIHQSPLHDSKLQVLSSFVIEILTTGGRPSQSMLQQFLQEGYDENQVLDLLLGIAMKTISNYANHLMQTEVDPQFG